MASILLRALLVLTLSQSASAGGASAKTGKINGNPINNVVSRAQSLFRRHIDLSGRLTPHSKLPPYERLGCLPAFAVTTSWGSPYMIFDKLSPEESAKDLALNEFFTTGNIPRALTDDGTNSPEDDLDKSANDVEYNDKVRESNSMTSEEVEQEAEIEYEQSKQAFKSRTTALYFTDPEDAVHLVDEMKQMGNGMNQADIRVMATSMARAVRHASRLGKGVPTGQTIDDQTGRLDSSAIRYKLVPSKRELYYAATRCVGRERVGLFDTKEDDARKLVLSPMELLEVEQNEKNKPGKNTVNNLKTTNRNTKESMMKRKYKHMKGQTAVPVFYADGMKRKLTKNNHEIPLFMSYEDLIKAWDKMKLDSKSSSTATTVTIPEKPPVVEVFNFVDVVVAMDRNQHNKLQQMDNALQKTIPRARFAWARKSIAPLLTYSSKHLRDVPKIGDDDLDKVVFVPSSRAIDFREKTTKKGNGKARLKRMR